MTDDKRADCLVCSALRTGLEVGPLDRAGVAAFVASAVGSAVDVCATIGADVVIAHYCEAHAAIRKRVVDDEEPTS